MLRFGVILAAILVSCAAAYADTVDDHFFGTEPVCAARLTPLILVTDVTRTGEIDDTISLQAYRRLEQMGCVRIVAVVSIFGNDGSSTAQVHANLIARLAGLGIGHWPILRGPDRRVPFTPAKNLTEDDHSRLAEIAAAIRAQNGVVIAELGPLTVSARLLMHGMVEPRAISRILGVGGREAGEQFSPGKRLLFAFRDMNVAEDREAMRYLVANHAQKLWLVTYRTGIGARMVAPGDLDFGGDKALTDHARKRAAKLKLIGYGGMIPSWDTWTTSYFLEGGEERLGCRIMLARMRQAEGFKPTDSMQLQLLDAPDRYGRFVTACHQIAKQWPGGEAGAIWKAPQPR